MSVLSRRTNEQIKRAEITLIIHEQSFYTIAKKKQRKRIKQVSGHIQGQSDKLASRVFPKAGNAFMTSVGFNNDNND